MSIIKRSKKQIVDLNGTNYTVSTLAQRNALQGMRVEDKVLVLDDGDGKWAIYVPTAIVNDQVSNWIKINDQDALENSLTPEGLKTAYESNADTNAFTDEHLNTLNNLPQQVELFLDEHVVENNTDTTQGKLITTGYLDIGNTDKDYWPTDVSLLQLLDGPDRTVWVEQGTIDAPTADFTGYVKVERGPNVGVGLGLLKATSLFSRTEHIYGKTPFGDSGWFTDEIYNLGEWMDLRPYLNEPYFWASYRNGGNHIPEIRIVANDEVQLRGVVNFNAESESIPMGPMLQIPEGYRPKMTSGGVCFSDSATPLWFGYSSWILSGELNYSNLSDHKHGNLTFIHVDRPEILQNGAVELSGVRYFLK